MVDGGYGSRRYAKIIGVLGITLALVGCGGLSLLPLRTDLAEDQNFQSYNQVQAAYASIVPGETREADLNKLGFNAAVQPNAEVISYLGVIERLMPPGFDHGSIISRLR